MNDVRPAVEGNRYRPEHIPTPSAAAAARCPSLLDPICLCL